MGALWEQRQGPGCLITARLQAEPVLHPADRGMQPHACMCPCLCRRMRRSCASWCRPLPATTTSTSPLWAASPSAWPCPPRSGRHSSPAGRQRARPPATKLWRWGLAVQQQQQQQRGSGAGGGGGLFEALTGRSVGGAAGARVLHPPGAVWAWPQALPTPAMLAHVARTLGLLPALPPPPPPPSRTAPSPPPAPGAQGLARAVSGTGTALGAAASARTAPGVALDYSLVAAVAAAAAVSAQPLHGAAALAGRGEGGLPGAQGAGVRGKGGSVGSGGGAGGVEATQRLDLRLERLVSLEGLDGWCPNLQVRGGGGLRGGQLVGGRVGAGGCCGDRGVRKCTLAYRQPCLLLRLLPALAGRHATKPPSPLARPSRCCWRQATSCARGRGWRACASCRSCAWATT